MSEESERYRLEMLRHLEQKDRRSPPAEVLQAQKVVAKFREQQARRREAIERLGAPLPDPELCPECHSLHDRSSKLKPLDSDTDIDVLKCPVCGYRQERVPPG